MKDTRFGIVNYWHVRNIKGRENFPLIFWVVQLGRSAMMCKRQTINKFGWFLALVWRANQIVKELRFQK